MTDADPTLWTLFLSTVALRPYVFVFLAVYLFSNTLVFGFLQTLWFTVGGYFLVFLAEFSSTRTGFPFGFYYYIDTTRQQELWLSDVPFMDSLSFTFLAHASYMTALFLCAPLWRRRSDVQIVDTKAIRRSPSVLVLTVTLFVLLDIVIDPVALQGSRWFLGQIYGYYEEGVYFGVPLANFLGWGIVGLALVMLHRVLDGVYRSRPRRAWGMAWVPYRGLIGPLLYLGVFGFNVAVTFMIGEHTLGVVDLFLLSPLVILAWTQIRRPSNQATQRDLEAHCEDFPASPLRRRLWELAS
ncbi:carotenoid biosynthesis protein [Candidatus Entotheonella palauensis]|uniref:carotenoid biosynthesis protein n=1 Tax=Candidatus Entotheonella palauensis TaxID=93172 RepID=UPI000B7C87B5|nr:carotenoid biosynthesis protein [Candidatus Entotheonella palauensis]